MYKFLNGTTEWDFKHFHSDIQALGKETNQDIRQYCEYDLCMPNIQGKLVYDLILEN